MKSLKSTICVRVDKNEKELAKKILREEGISMTTLVNMAITEVIEQNGVPFKIKQPVPNKGLLEALEEGEDILNGKIKTKKYHSVEELIQDLENDED